MLTHQSAQLDLAHLEPFRLGTLLVDPPRRLVCAGEFRQVIEPKVIQVLAALANAEGRTLSRDDLIHQCWDDRVVGDGAIYRVISHARMISRTVAGGSFEIENIKYVGYRLVTAESAVAALPVTRHHDRGTIDRRTFGIIGGVVAASAAFALMRWSRPAQASTVAVEFFKRAEAVRQEEDGGDSGQRAIALYRSAIEDSPNFAAAWGGMALAYHSLLESASEDDVDRLGEMGLSAARRALEVDSDEIRGQLAKTILPPDFGAWERRLRQLGQLQHADEENWEIKREIGRGYAQLGNVGIAAELLGQAVRAHPLIPRVQGDHFYALWAARRFHEAEQVLENGIRRWPRNWYLWNAQFQYLTLMGRGEAAARRVSSEEHRPANLSPVAISKRLKAIEVLAGRQANIHLELVDAYTEEVVTHSGAIRNAIMMLAALGASDRILEILRGFYFAEGPFKLARRRFSRRPTYFLFLPPFDRLRALDGFQALMKRLELPGGPQR